MAKSKQQAEPPVLRHMCSVGTLLGYGTKGVEWTFPQKLKRIKNAGFDGFLGRVIMFPPEVVEESGLIFACTTDMGGPQEAERKLKRIGKYNARVVNVQMLDHDTGTAEAVACAREVMRVAGELDMDVSIEVHRDTCTETPEKTYALAEGFEKEEKRPLKMTWDFSHPAVVKHLSPPYFKRLIERPDLVQLANQIHFRPFNGHHAMIPALGPGGKLTPEFLDCMEFADQLLALWLKAATPGRELFVCPEQIPGGYHLSVFGDRFRDVKAIRGELEKSWQRHLANWKPPRKAAKKAAKKRPRK